MSLPLLYADELRGLARSRVMAALWVGLPVLTLVVRLLRPETEGIPLTSLVAVLVASIGGTLSAVLLSTTVTSERNRHAYDLFLIRPVTRRDLVLAKYFAALSCVIVAALLSVVVGGVVDAATGTLAPGALRASLESLLMSVAGMAIACAVGMLFGILIDSVAVSAILSVYLGNQLSALIILPAILITSLNVVAFSVGVGIAVPALLLLITILVFERKSL